MCPFDSATTALLIFSLTQLLALGTYVWRKNRERRNLIGGLYEEVSVNLDALNKFLEKSAEPPQQMLDLVNSDRQYRPHIVYAQQNRFYVANLDELPSTSQQLNRLLVDFYSDLESLRAEIEAVQFKSFETVLARDNVIGSIWSTTRQSRESGEKVLAFMEGRYRRILASGDTKHLPRGNRN